MTSVILVILMSFNDGWAVKEYPQPSKEFCEKQAVEIYEKKTVKGAFCVEVKVDKPQR